METLRFKRSVYLIIPSENFYLTNKQIKRYLMLELKFNETVKTHGSSTKKHNEVGHLWSQSLIRCT